MDEYLLLESETLRKRLCTEENTNVLNEVGKLISLTEAGWTTIEYIAKFYKVSIPTIKTIILRHKNEIIMDGYKILQSKDFNSTSPKQWGNILGEDINRIKKFAGTKTRSLALLSRRAALRIGMLLRDSDVAKSMRSYLLNAERKTEKHSIDNQQTLLKMAGQLTQHAGQLAQNAEQLIHQANLVAAVINEMQQTKEFTKKLNSKVCLHEDRLLQLENIVYNKSRESFLENIDKRKENINTSKKLQKSFSKNKKRKNIDAVINEAEVEELKKEMKKTGKVPVSMWKKFNKHFAIQRYALLPKNCFEEAMVWIKGLQ